jgi:hypothetical protein
MLETDERSKQTASEVGEEMTAIGNRLPVGKGSRGGHWHDPEYRREYSRAWRAAHPAYREREALRRCRKREELIEENAIEKVAFSDILLLVLAEDVSKKGVRQVALSLGTTHTNVGRWIRRERTMSADGVDAIITTYGIDPLVAIYNLARRGDVETNLSKAIAANYRGNNQYTAIKRVLKGTQDDPLVPADT